MNYALISVAVTIGLGVALFYTIGFAGIAIATSAASWLTVAQMGLKLSKLNVWRPSAQAWSKIVRVTAASLLLGVIVALGSHFRAVLEAPLPGLVIAKEVAVLALAAIGALSYPVFLFAFGGVTPAEAKAALRRRR
jgi:putative peptidoglycan lipid II flippase